MTALVVIAKQPVAGRVKTRLTPPCSPEQAAELAAAALTDTLDVVQRTPAARRVLVFDGDPRDWARPGIEVIPQRGEGLGQRLAAAFDDVGCQALLIGMDTPQLTKARLAGALEAVARPGVDAVLGPACDGGYWCVGFKQPAPAAFQGVPMSAPDTYARQCERLGALGLATVHAPELCDVDTIADARAVAAAAPRTRFAKTLAAIL
ncbi:MAG: TIGR04282 family arsenosugar biosynthesis glycosyltransferase [Solirubrobacterales bacterium]|nr:TIGR04282 family arsenosugar biosynthesis glycosyltransferase [Solirubrobacterales bacterium]